MVRALLAPFVAARVAATPSLEAAARVLIALTFTVAVDDALPANLRGRLGQRADAYILWKVTPAFQHGLQTHEHGSGIRQVLDVAARVEGLEHTTPACQPVLEARARVTVPQ